MVHFARVETNHKILWFPNPEEISGPGVWLLQSDEEIRAPAFGFLPNDEENPAPGLPV